MRRPLPRWLDRLLDAIDAANLPRGEAPVWMEVVADLGVRMFVAWLLLVWLAALGYVAGLGPDPLPPALRDPCVQRGHRVCNPDGTWVQPEKPHHNGSETRRQETSLPP